MTTRLADRIDGWPWSKTVAAVGVWTFVLANATAALGAVVGFLILLFASLTGDPSEAWIADKLLKLYEYVTDASLWAMGVGGAALVGKRAATKPEVIDAEARAAQGAPPAAPAAPPRPDPAASDATPALTDVERDDDR